MKEIEDIIRNLEFLISEDCTDTQFDCVDDIESAIEIIKIIKNAEIDINHLTEICEAEREGNLMVLPCKVGDKVFITNLLKYEKQYYFKNYYFNFNGEIIMNIYDQFEKENYPIKLNDFGKTVFLTREEAEKALVEMEGNDEF